MKKYVVLLVLLMGLSLRGFSQEKYGHTLNMGLGVGYYGYVGHPVPVFNLNYEFDVVKNLTLAPFISFYTYSNNYYYGKNGQYYYNYQTVIPVGIKSAYYFDDLLNASDKWDFYAGTSLGFVIAASHWDASYPGDRNAYDGPGTLFIAAHIGAEYHFTPRIGGFLDLSTGVSTIGLAIHK